LYPTHKAIFIKYNVEYEVLPAPNCKKSQELLKNKEGELSQRIQRVNKGYL
jgi:hypothetical protein